MKVVSDASVLINLSKIDKLELLKALFKTVYIAPSVYQEVVVKGKGKEGSKEVKESPWIRVKETKDKLAVELLSAELDTGEAETIVLARELKAKFVLIDEVYARKVAQLGGISVIGTLGVLVRSYQKKIIYNLKSLLDGLINKGTWISEKVYESVLKETGC